MSDFLDAKRNEIRARMNELEDAVHEYTVLNAALDVFARVDSNGPAPTPVPQRASRKPMAARGENKRKVMDAIADHPGASVGEIAQITGVAKALIYNITRAGVANGDLTREDLPSGVVGFKLADLEPAGKA